MEKQASQDSSKQGAEADTADNMEDSSSTCSSDMIFNMDNIQIANKQVEVDARSQIKKTKTSKKKAKIPHIRIFYGTFVHCSDHRGSFVILEKWLIGVENGKIIFSEPVDKYTEILEDRKLKEFAKDITISLGEGTLMMPGFVDAHTDAASFLALGIQDGGSDHFIPQSRYTEKFNLIHDDRIAKQLFAKVIEYTVRSGSTTVAYDGTHIESAARHLAHALARHKQRGFVGMDACVPGQREDDHMVQMTKLHDVITYFKNQNTTVGMHLMLSAPLPDWLEDRVANLHQQTGIPIKVSLTSQESGMMVDLTEQTSLEYHSKHKLINDKTLALHDPDWGDSELTMLKEAAASVIYCPAADIRRNSFTDLHKLIHSEIKVALGTDFSNSGSFSMLEAIRQCVRVAKQHQKIPPTDSENIDYRDFFFMATLGGAEVLGLADRVGNFEVGKEFDAILVDPHVPDSPFFTVINKDTSQDILERFLFGGDDRNITAVYISGQRVK